MVITCLCALWCDTCEAYREGFFALAAEFPQVRFVWLDIEDNADQVGDIEVENFPTIRITRGEAELFLGPLPPQHEHLKRLIRALLEKS
ncbi:MAG: hypothetical protein EPO20_09835 [Betaproteobacteria bacterium]|nr:MAG: hypothetical protein EPO20_09835 [Betaproteobacteria bacterium]